MTIRGKGLAQLRLRWSETLDTGEPITKHDVASQVGSSGRCEWTPGSVSCQKHFHILTEGGKVAFDQSTRFRDRIVLRGFQRGQACANGLQVLVPLPDPKEVFVVLVEEVCR